MFQSAFGATFPRVAAAAGFCQRAARLWKRTTTARARAGRGRKEGCSSPRLREAGNASRAGRSGWQSRARLRARPREFRAERAVFCSVRKRGGNTLVTNTRILFSWFPAGKARFPDDLLCPRKESEGLGQDDEGAKSRPVATPQASITLKAQRHQPTPRS